MYRAMKMKFGLLIVVCALLFGCAVQPQGKITQRSVYYLPLVQSDSGPKQQQDVDVQQISDRPQYSSPVRNGAPVNHSTYSPVIK